MKKLNKMLSGALAALMIFTSVPVYATSEITNENTTTMTSEELSAESISSETETPEEISTSETATSETSEETPELQDKPTAFVESDEDSEGTDNWELSTVFYDSTVNDGTTPLTSIDWDASDGSYKEGSPREIVVQITYKNTNAVTTYMPGDLKITIPNLAFNASNANLNTEITVGANDDNHVGYDWDFVNHYSKITSGNNASGTIVDYNLPSSSMSHFIFENAKKFDEKSNFQGSIQITYKFTPKEESPEAGAENCFHSLNSTQEAILSYGDVLEIGTLTSPGYPNKISNKYNESDFQYEYESVNNNPIFVTFSDDSKLSSGGDDWYTSVYFYNGSDKLDMARLSAANQSFVFHNNDLKITSECRYGYNQFKFSMDIYTYSTSIRSNSISFNYEREYVHPWKYYDYKFTKSAEKITSFDGLGENASDYIWVKYLFTIGGIYSGYSYPYIHSTNMLVKDSFPEGCIVLSSDMSELSPDSDNTYDIYLNNIGTNSNYYETSKKIYVGYPKSIYNENADNLLITNTADLHVKYADSDEYTYHKNSSVSLNLADYIFEYTGDLYGISKTSHDSNYHYSDFMLDKTFPLINNNYYNYISNDFGWDLTGSAIFTGKPLTIRLGDDLLYITAKDGSYRKLNDSEYCFTYVRTPRITNGNNIIITTDCNLKLYVRYANNKDYVLYEKFNPSSSSTDFTKEGKVVGYYFEISNLNQSAIFQNNTNTNMIRTNISPDGDIADSGTVYNFSYLQVFAANENGDLTLLNPQTLDNYTTFVTKEHIAAYDKNTYGNYIQRSCASKKYNDLETIPFDYYRFLTKTMGSITQDAENEYFNSSAKLSINLENKNDLNSNSTYINKVYLQNTDKINFISQIVLYDLLPEGMDLNSSKNEILESLNVKYTNWSYYKNFYNKDGEQLFSNNEELIAFLKEHTTIEIKENWRDTDRTYLYINIDLEDTPLMYIGINTNGELDFYFEYKWGVSYDAYLEYGKTWTNIGYLQAYYENNELLDTNGNAISDNGYFDKAVTDINENGDISNKDLLSYSKATDTITSVVSTNQDVQTQTASSLSNYSTGTVPAEYGKDYSYKLRVRSGENDVTNLIIYDNLEKWTKDKNGNFIESAGNKEYWQGEFLGIDTSYAESKGYNVKVWYSENEKAGTLAEDPSWQEYSDSVDKTKVKSLAFQYLDSKGNPAVLPANSLTYVEINMKAPTDEDITTLAYNGCWTQWNALDEFGQPVDFITGINSNIVKVALPNSVDTESGFNIKFVKEILNQDNVLATTDDFEKLNLSFDDSYNFMLKLTNTETSDIYNLVLNSKDGITISNLPLGTYTISEADDIYFDFVDMNILNATDGVTFTNTDGVYTLSVTDSVESNSTIEIKIQNKLEPTRSYEDKAAEENLFNGTPIVEENSLLNKLIEFFK